MRLRLESGPRQRLRAALVALAIIAVGYVLRGPLLQVCGLTLGAGALCFIVSPLEKIYERRLSRSVASLAALLSLILCVVALGVILLPTMLREMAGLAGTLPALVARVTDAIEAARLWLETRLPGIALPEMDLDGARDLFGKVASGTFSLAVNAADVIGTASMMAVLAWFFLQDRERLLLRLELLLPQSFRHIAVRMGIGVCGELRLYLRGELMIAGTVALLSATALSLIGVRGALALGPLIGILNMIPYFGPFIGGAPAVLIALGDGWQRAALTLAALTLVQQLDGAWISPRIMGSLTGFSPALVLVGIYAGARLGGIGGMLLALPAMMSVRTIYRIFVQEYENI